MSYYPWSTLGLDGPADERKIRSAYAKRLRNVRPDENPIAFQALVAARDEAMRQAKTVLQPAAHRPPLDIYVATSAERRSIDELENSNEAASRAPVLQFPIIETSVDFDVARSPEQAIVGGPPVPAETKPFLIDLDGTSDEPDASLMKDPRTVDDLSHGDDGEGLRLPDRLKDFLQGRSEESGATLLRSFDDMGLQARGDIEARTFAAIAERLQAILRDLSGDKPRFARNDHSDRERAITHRDVVLGLDELFGWTRNDRTIYRILPREEVDKGLAHLRALAQQALAERSKGMPRASAGKVPVLSASDLASFFGSEFPHYERRYQQAVGLGRWPVDWQWRRFWYGPFWALGLGQYRIAALWVAAMMAMGFLYTALGDLVHTTWPESAHSNVATAAILSIAVLPPLAVHGLIAAYGTALEIQRAARKVRRADRRMLFEPEARTAFLQKGAPDFRVARPIKSNFFLRYWWVWWGLFVVIRLLLTAAGK